MPPPTATAAAAAAAVSIQQPQQHADSFFFKCLSLAITWPLRLVTPLAWLCLGLLLLELGDPLFFAKHRVLRAALHALVAVEAGFYLWFLQASARLQKRHRAPALTPGARRDLLVSIRRDHSPALHRFVSERRLRDETGEPFQFLDRWFPGASSLAEVGQDDLRSWLAWAFFGKYEHEVAADGPAAAAELESLAKEIATAVGKRGVKLPPGSTGVTVRRLNLDRVTAKHRPFVYYVATAVMDAAAGWAIRAAGFERHCIGDNFSYYIYDPPTPSTTSLRTNGHATAARDAPLAGQDLPLSAAAPAPPPPLVFVHGVGMGLATYIFFVLQLVREAAGSTSSTSSTSSSPSSVAGRSIMLIELPHVSLKLGQENVPSVSEFVAAAAAALKRHGFGPARWVGHSLGTCLVGAVTKARPELVESLVLVDPVCFLLWEVDVLENFCYRKPITAMQDIIHYHMSQELFISHFFHRHFWWYESVLFPSDIPPHVPAMVFVSETDEISHAGRVLAYLSKHVQAAQARPTPFSVHELKGQGHGGWIVRPASQVVIVSAALGC